MTEEKEYALGKSAKGLGKLCPILKAKDGQIIDGFHRQNEDPDWPTVTVDSVDSPVKLELARLASNFCRRTMKADEFENRLRFLIEKGNMKPEEISEVTGISLPTVYRHIPEDLKDAKRSEAISKGMKAASEDVRQNLSSDSSLQTPVITSTNGKFHDMYACEICGLSVHISRAKEITGKDGKKRTTCSNNECISTARIRDESAKVKEEQPLKARDFDGWAQKEAAMKVQHSQKEIDLLKELSSRGIMPTTDEPVCLWQTVPDGKYEEKKLAYYVDGQPHDNGKAKDRDERITGALEALGWKVHRFNTGSVKDWADRVQEALGKKET